MGLYDTGKYHIPFSFNSKTTLLKVAKYTTFDDVIEMLAHLERMNIRTADYCVYEMTSHLPRAIQGRDLVLKVLRSWGCESDSFCFRVDRKQAYGSDQSVWLTPVSTERFIDGMYTKIQGKANRSFPAKKPKLPTRKRDINGRTDVRKKSEEQKTGKQIMFAKFFIDLITSKSKLSRFSSNIFSTAADSRRDVTNTSSLKDMLQQRCRNVWDQNSYSESDASCDCSSLTASSSGDDSFDSTDSSDHVHESISKSGLDKAFVKSSADSDSDEGIDATSMTTVDLNSAFVSDVDVMQLTHVSQRHSLLSIKDFDNVAASNKLNSNLSDDDFLKELFGCHGSEHVVSDDEAMESFMSSRLDSF